METLFLIRAKFGCCRVSRKVFEYMNGSRKIWLKNYRIALRNNGVVPKLQARREKKFVHCGRVCHRCDDKLRSDKWLDPLQTELRQTGMYWRIVSRKQWAANMQITL